MTDNSKNKTSPQGYNSHKLITSTSKKNLDNYDEVGGRKKRMKIKKKRLSKGG